MSITSLQELELTECCICGVQFAAPSIVMNNKRKNGGFVHCPNGHSVGWSEGEAEKQIKRLREDLKAKTRRVESLASERDMLELSNRGLKAANTRLKNKNKKEE
jgi:hypothetical protein